MADTVLTIKAIEDLFWSLTLQMLGLVPTAPANQDRARIAWPSDGAPAWEINEDVAFLLVSYDDDPVTRQMEIAYQNKDAVYADRTMSYTRVLRVIWNSYGPNSFDATDRIRSSLVLPEIKQLLQVSNLALITDVPMPVRAPELFNGQWWDRTSFYARFNEGVVRHSDVAYLQSADVKVITERDGGS